MNGEIIKKTGFYIKTEKMIYTKKINAFLCKELSKTIIDTNSVSVVSSDMRQERIL